MKCPVCRGEGSVPYPLDYKEGLWDECVCERCNGTGEVNMTNEQWLNSCTPEEKVNWIVEIIDEMGTFPDYLYGSIESKKRFWGNWLKREHED